MYIRVKIIFLETTIFSTFDNLTLRSPTRFTNSIIDSRNRTYKYVDNQLQVIKPLPTNPESERVVKHLRVSKNDQFFNDSIVKEIATASSAPKSQSPRSQTSHSQYEAKSGEEYRAYN